MGTDQGSTGFCTARRIARSLSKSKASQVWMSLFSHPPQYKTDLPLWKPMYGPGNVLNPHGSEVRYVFDNMPPSGTKTDEQVASAMSASWLKFAATGNPSDSQWSWPNYKDKDDAVFRIVAGQGSSVEHGVRAAACDWWDKRGEGVIEGQKDE